MSKKKPLPKTWQPPPGSVKTSFYLPDALLHGAKVRAAQERVTLRELLVRAVEQYLTTPLRRTPR